MKTLRYAALAVTSTLLLAACGGGASETAPAAPAPAPAPSEEPEEPQFPAVLEIRQAAIGALPNLPVILAADSPYQEEYGIRIINVPVTSPTDYVTGLGRGDLDVVPGTPSIAIAAREQGIPITVIARGSFGNTQFIIAPGAGVGERDWDGFKALVESRAAAGNKVKMGAVAAASTNYVLCMETFELKGIDAELIDIINIPAFPEHPAAMERGEVDLICTTEPFATIAVSKGIGQLLDTPFETEAGDILGALITAERNLTDPIRREAVRRWMQVVIRIMDDLNADPSIATEWVKGAVGVDDAAAARMLTFAGWTPPADLVQLGALAQGHFRLGQTQIDWSTRIDEWVDLSLQNEILGN
jgi:ABC-type nitrate/sulfonate/bicarbonate transport system substrate-binding protein